MGESLNQKISNEGMASNPDFLWCKEERKQESFVKLLKHFDMSSENTVNYVLNSLGC